MQTIVSKPWSRSVVSDLPLPERIHYLDSILRQHRDPQTRFSQITEWARQRPPMDAALRLDRHRVPGCQVRLWWVSSMCEGCCWFQSDSDALTLKAVTGLLADVYSDVAPLEIIGHPPTFLEELTLLKPLAENRAATIRRVTDLLMQFAAAPATGE